jgi:hypothetical protein
MNIPQAEKREEQKFWSACNISDQLIKSEVKPRFLEMLYQLATL